MKFMRKFICFWEIAACTFATAIETNSLELKSAQPSEAKTSFIPYIQLVQGILPGVGCSIRVQKGSLGLQFDANATILVAGVREITLAALFYPWVKSNEGENYGGWNLGIGGGIGSCHGRNEQKTLPVFPFFVGYQAKKYFFSATVHPLDRVVSWQKWTPSVKYGWCF